VRVAGGVRTRTFEPVAGDGARGWGWITRETAAGGRLPAGAAGTREAGTENVDGVVGGGSVEVIAITG
jgi:hypothetical protein